MSSQYYATPDGLNSAVIASYAQLRGFYGREQLLSLTQVGTDTWMAADQSGSNNKDFDSYGGGLNSTVAPLANTWNPAYQAINTLNAALDRGPRRARASPPRTKRSLLGEAHFLRALNYFTLVQTVRRRHALAAREQGRRRERGARSRGGRLQGDHRRPRYGVHHAPGDAGRLRPRDEGRRADAAVQGVPHPRVSGRTRRASRPTSRRRSPTRRP